MKASIDRFEKILAVKGITKKAFATYCQIPYDTVAGWKRTKRVPGYAMILARDMPSRKEYVTAAELLEAGMPQAVLWNNDPHKKVPVEIFIVTTLQRSYNDFVIETLADYFVTERIFEALARYPQKLGQKSKEQILQRLQKLRTDHYDRSKDPQAA